MKDLVQDVMNTLFILLGRPQSMLEFHFTLWLGVFVLVLVLSKTAEAAGALRARTGWGLLVVVASGMATVLFWSGTRTMLIPRLRADLIPYALPGAMLLLAVVVLAITQTALRCTLVAAVMGWAVSLAAVAAGILLAGAGFDLWSSLKQDARAAGIHRQTIEEFSDLLGP
ncbi:MAG TPA: hypothetical protein EYP62_05775 [Kiritimatiellae bacterium]|nr:hypothetical protein [Kiritimatiellia bacterium]